MGVGAVWRVGWRRRREVGIVWCGGIRKGVTRESTMYLNDAKILEANIYVSADQCISSTKRDGCFKTCQIEYRYCRQTCEDEPGFI